MISKKISQSDGSVSTSIDGGDNSTVDYNLSVVDSQASEVLPPEELPFLEDDRKLPAVVQKTGVDELVDDDSTDTEYINALTQNDNKAKSKEKNENRLKLNKSKTKSRNIKLRSDTPKRSLRNREFDT